jgi:hypothetical protein
MPRTNKKSLYVISEFVRVTTWKSTRLSLFIVISRIILRAAFIDIGKSGIISGKSEMSINL